MYTLAKVDMTFMLYLLLVGKQDSSNFAVLDTLVSSLSETYPDFRKLGYANITIHSVKSNMHSFVILFFY